MTTAVAEIIETIKPQLERLNDAEREELLEKVAELVCNHSEFTSEEWVKIEAALARSEADFKAGRLSSAEDVFARLEAKIQQAKEVE